MDLKKTVLKNQVELNQAIRQSGFSERKEIKQICSKNYMDPVRWYCEDCCLVLTSKTQAQEHFVGKKHQNVIKNKRTSNKFSNMEMQQTERCVANTSLFSCSNLQDASYSVKPSINFFWESKYSSDNLHNFIPSPASRDNILETVMKGEKRMVSSSDLSIYRTPSGKYYCQPCNLTVNSQAQFIQHSESRKHKHKASRTSCKIK